VDKGAIQDLVAETLELCSIQVELLRNNILHKDHCRVPSLFGRDEVHTLAFGDGELPEYETTLGTDRVVQILARDRSVLDDVEGLAATGDRHG